MTESGEYQPQATKFVTWAQLVISLAIILGGLIGYVIKVETELTMLKTRQDLIVERNIDRDVQLRVFRSEIMQELTGIKQELNEVTRLLYQHNSNRQRNNQ